jgi:hypothetical protein
VIITTHSDQEYENTLELLRMINELREHGPGFNPPYLGDTPWIKTQYANPAYL